MLVYEVFELTPYCFFNFNAVSIVESDYSDEVTVDINTGLKPTLTVIDGFVGMEGSGAVEVIW